MGFKGGGSYGWCLQTKNLDHLEKKLPEDWQRPFAVTTLPGSFAYISMRSRLWFQRHAISSRRPEVVSKEACMATDGATEQPKYPSPPRSGNAFAAAVFAAIPSLVLTVVLLGEWSR